MKEKENDNWKLRREVSRLRTDMCNLQRSVGTYSSRIKKRLERIALYIDPQETKCIDPQETK